MSPGCSVCYFLALNLCAALQGNFYPSPPSDLEILSLPGIDLFKNTLNKKAAFGSTAEIW